MKDLLFEVIEKSKEEAKKIRENAKVEYEKKKKEIEEEFEKKVKDLENSLKKIKEEELKKLRNELEIKKKTELLKELKSVKEDCIKNFELNKKEKEKFFQIIKEKIKEIEKKYGKNYKLEGNKESLESLGVKGKVNENLSLGVIVDYGNFRIDLTLNNLLKLFQEELERI